MKHAGLPWWGRGYVLAVATLGMVALGHSLYSLYTHPIGSNWFVLALLTLVAGAATVKLPSVPATISISETFVFTSTLLFGPAAGTMTVALDALVISLSLARKGHPSYRIIFNVFALPAALWISAHIFFWTANLPPLATSAVTVDIGSLLKPLILFTACYFGLNSWLIAFAIAIEKKLSPFQVWKDNFAWLSLNYFGGASVAALLVTYTREIDFRFVAIVLPLLAVLYYTFSASMGRIADTNRHLSELNGLYMSTIETLAMAIDAKDQITHGHIRRVQHYAVALAKGVGIKEDAHIRAIEAASLLHDMGKLAVPEYILNKPGPLTPAEFEKMKLHASVGADILSSIEFPYPVVPIVRHHHESWDGSGYPDGLRGTDIPIGARILSVVDCFDALTSDRPYRPRLTDSEAIRILVERRGRMYDPLVVDTFITIYTSIEPLIPKNAAHDGLSAITRSMAPAAQSAKSKARFDEINASTEETIALYDLAKALSGWNDIESVGNVVAKHVRRIVPASTCVFFLYDEVKDELRVAFANGEHSAYFTDLRIPRGQRLTGWIAANKLSVRNSNPILDLGDAARSLKPALRSCLGAPILLDNDMLGVLTLYSNSQAPFSEDHQRIIEAVARQLGPTLKALKQPDLSERHWRTDRIGKPESATTGNVNASTPSVLLVDLGASARPQGLSEELLTIVAESVRNALRPTDTLLQFNDDSLVVILNGTDRDTASALFEKVWRELGKVRASSGGMTRISLGLACPPSDGSALQALVEFARANSVSVNIPGPSASIH